MDTGEGAVLDARGDGQLGEAKGALAGDVEELGGQGDVEVCGVFAKAQVDVDVGPLVVQVKLEGATIERPVSDVAGLVLDSGA